ncbi:TetR family transcriptional regulator, partial [Streptomyces sp. WM6386]
AQPTSAARVMAVFDASHAWSAQNSPKGCSMVNAHAEISDPSHPAYAIITGQKQWMLALFTDLAGDITPDGGDHLGRTLMLLHEGALVAHGLNILADPFGHAREQAQALLAAAGDSATKR